MVSGACNKTWINRTIKQIRRRKQRQHNLVKEQCHQHTEKIQTSKRQMQKECRKAHNNYLSQVIYQQVERSYSNILNHYVEAQKNSCT